MHFIKLLNQYIRSGNISSALLSGTPIAQQKIMQFEASDIDSYLAASIIDLIRFEFLAMKISFSFKTVMSHEIQVDFLK